MPDFSIFDLNVLVGDAPKSLLHRVGVGAFAESCDFAEQISLAVCILEGPHPAPLLDHIENGKGLHRVWIVARTLLLLLGAQRLIVPEKKLHTPSHL